MLHKAIQNRWCRLALAVAATLLYAIEHNDGDLGIGLEIGASEGSRLRPSAVHEGQAGYKKQRRSQVSVHGNS